MRVPTVLLRRTVTITPRLGSNAYGPEFGTPVAGVRARVEGRRRVVRGPDGQDRTSTATATIRPDVTVATPARPPAPEDRVTVDGVDFEVLEVVALEGLARTAGYDLILGGP